MQWSEMNKKLERIIKDLYQTFSIYPLKGNIEGCPCCVSNSDKSNLHSKPLKELNSEDLSRFSFKAMSTFGGVDDFKHFLPRILELSVNDELDVDEFIVLGKLDYGKWNDWPVNEQESIRELLLHWWCFQINNKSGFDLFLFVEIAKKLNDFTKMLDCWETAVESIGFVNLIEFIEFHFSNLTYGAEEFKEWNKKQLNEFKMWINLKSGLIEKGFFHYESLDKSLAESASNALYILEVLSKQPNQ